MSGKLLGCDEHLTPEHAVILKQLPGLGSMDYIKAVATVVGSHQIHSIYSNGEVVKLYLKEKKYVRCVIESGVLLKDCLVTAEFNVPPGTKVSLLNVDPILPNWSLECVLGFYGSLESAIMRQKICDEVGFSHIEGSTRIVYMKLYNDKIIPNKLPLFHGDTLYEIEVQIKESENSNFTIPRIITL